MGTSSSYGGPKKRPLLPRWATDPDELGDTEGAEVEPEGAQQAANANGASDGSWKAAKTQMTRFAGGLGREGLRAAATAYVSAMGGSKAAARSAGFGRTVARGVARFFSGVSSTGVTATMSQLGLGALAGSPVDVLIAGVADTILQAPTSLEASAARSAMLSVLASVFDKYSVEDAGLEQLDSMDAAAVREVVTLFVQEYIYQRWLQELGSRIENKSIDKEDALRLEREVKEFIIQTVELDFEGIDVLHIDWNSQQGRESMESIFEMAYGLLEVGQ